MTTPPEKFDARAIALTLLDDIYQLNCGDQKTTCLTNALQEAYAQGIADQRKAVAEVAEEIRFVVKTFLKVCKHHPCDGCKYEIEDEAVSRLEGVLKKLSEGPK